MHCQSSGFPWERHAPAWLLKPGWNPAFLEGTGAGLTNGTSDALQDRSPPRHSCRVF